MPPVSSNRAAKQELRPRRIDRLLVAEFSAKTRRQTIIDAETEKLDARAVARAIKRAGKDGLVDLGPGRFEGFVIDRKIELLSQEPGLTEIAGTVRVAGGPSVLRGVMIRPPHGEPSLVVEGTTMICEDCDIYGRIEVNGGNLHLRNCRVVAPNTAITLNGKASAEVIATRISGSPVGILIGEHAACALYNSRIEACHGNEESSPGAGIYTSGVLYSEGTEFFRNEVGVYFKTLSTASLFGCHFHANSHAALIVEGSDPSAKMLIASSRFDGFHNPECPMIAIDGGSISLEACHIDSPHGPALFLKAASLALSSCGVRTTRHAAIEMDAGSVSGHHTRITCDNGAALQVFGTTGTLHGGTLEGRPPIAGNEGGKVALDNVMEREPADKNASPLSTTPAPDSIESYLECLDQIIGQGVAKNELAKLLRLAFAARERKRQGIPPGEHKFSGLLSGPPGSGQTHAARVFASALHTMGELRSTEVVEITLADATVADPRAISAGIVVVRTSEASGISLKSPGAPEAVLRLVRSLDGYAHVLLEGDRQSLSAFIRSRPELSREFVVELLFTAYGPPELAALFETHCTREHIPLGLDAARKLSVTLHSLHDRLQRRYTDLDGIGGLFAEARRNYLERCAREGRFDLELEAGDIDAPLDRTTASALERSAELISICPSCNGENPWLPGLRAEYSCLRCGQGFVPGWGFWKNSTFFRKRRDGSEHLRSGAVASRRLIMSEPL